MYTCPTLKAEAISRISWHHFFFILKSSLRIMKFDSLKMLNIIPSLTHYSFRAHLYQIPMHVNCNVSSSKYKSIHIFSKL